MKKTIAVYEELCTRYEALLRSPTGRLMCAKLIGYYPRNTVSDLKKVDLILWQHRG